MVPLALMHSNLIQYYIISKYNNFVLLLLGLFFQL